MVAGAGFFPIATINSLGLKRMRYSDFKNNFVIMKRERGEIFLSDIPVPLVLHVCISLRKMVSVLTLINIGELRILYPWGINSPLYPNQHSLLSLSSTFYEFYFLFYPLFLTTNYAKLQIAFHYFLFCYFKSILVYRPNQKLYKPSNCF